VVKPSFFHFDGKQSGVGKFDPKKEKQAVKPPFFNIGRSGEI
jgi:hypothetical protein